MSRDEVERYTQDRLGNSRRELDEHRAREGDVVVHGAADGVQVIYESPDHATEVILEQVQAYNDGAAANSDTVRVYEVELDEEGAITQQTQRSAALHVAGPGTETYPFHGQPFTGSIAIDADFAGETSVGVISDHHEEHEPSSETTQTPGN